MRLQIYWRYATRSLGRGGQQTLFAIFCVAVGVMGIVALQLVGLMVNAALTGNMRAVNGGDLAAHSETGIVPASGKVAGSIAQKLTRCKLPPEGVVASSMIAGE